MKLNRWTIFSAICFAGTIFCAVGLYVASLDYKYLEQRSVQAVETDEKIIRACSILCCRASRSDDGKSCGVATKYTLNKLPKDTPVTCHCQVRTGKNEELLNMSWTVDLIGVR